MTLRFERRAPTVSEWLMVGALVILTIIVLVQTSRNAWLPPMKTDEMVVTVLLAAISAAILRSEWGKSGEGEQIEAPRAEQVALGTISNSFYGPRRRALTEGFAVGGGVLLGLWWGVSTWVILLTFMRHKNTDRGLWGLEIAVLVGVLCGGMIGAAIGRLVGNIWETRHRRRRLERAHFIENPQTPGRGA